MNPTNHYRRSPIPCFPSLKKRQMAMKLKRTKAKKKESSTAARRAKRERMMKERRGALILRPTGALIACWIPLILDKEFRLRKKDPNENNLQRYPSCCLFINLSSFRTIRAIKAIKEPRKPKYKQLLRSPRKKYRNIRNEHKQFDVFKIEKKGKRKASDLEKETSSIGSELRRSTRSNSDISNVESSIEITGSQTEEPKVSIFNLPRCY